MKEGVLTTVIDLRLPTKITRGLDMSNEQKKLSDFLDEVDKQNEKHAVPETTSKHDTYDFEFGTVYENYILERIGSHEGQYGLSFAMNMTSPDGEKRTLWVSQNMKKDLDFFLKNHGLTDALPVKVSFAKTKNTNEKSGREFHKLNLKLVASGDDVQFELDAL